MDKVKKKKPVYLFSEYKAELKKFDSNLILFDKGYDYFFRHNESRSSGDKKIKKIAHLLSILLTTDRKPFQAWAGLMAPFFKIMIKNDLNSFEELADLENLAKISKDVSLMKNLFIKFSPLFYIELEKLIIDNGEAFLRQYGKYKDSENNEEDYDDMDDEYESDHQETDPIDIAGTAFAIILAKLHLADPVLIEYVQNLLWVVLLPVVQNHYEPFAELFSQLDDDDPVFLSVAVGFVGGQMLNELTDILNSNGVMDFDEEGLNKWED